MRLPRVRFTVRRIMAMVVVAALASLAAAKVARDYPSTEHRVAILVGCVVAGAFGLGAMRWPLVFLAALLVIRVVIPSVDHPGLDVLNLSAEGCSLGWIIGALAGWVSRYFARAGGADPRGQSGSAERPR